MTEQSIKNCEEVFKLFPPPSPWDELVIQQTSYLLKDLTCLNEKYIRDFVNYHPLIVAKNGRNHIVVGQYRTWRLHQILNKDGQTEICKEMVKLVDIPSTKISEVAGVNLFIEGLIGTLQRTNELHYLQMIHKKLSKNVAGSILPEVKTDAQFANLLGFSRSSLRQKKT